MTIDDQVRRVKRYSYITQAFAVVTIVISLATLYKAHRVEQKAAEATEACQPKRSASIER